MQVNFYPRPPCGGRLRRFHSRSQCHRISIHALRVEGDAVPRRPRTGTFYFYPRPPCGGRRSFGSLTSNFEQISIHALRVEGDGKSSQNIVSFCSTNTKIGRSDITNYPLFGTIRTISRFFGVVSQLSFGAKLPVLSCLLAFRTRYSSSISSCGHCGQRPICSTFLL